MNSKQYLVRLTPHHQYFFGQEQSFGGTDGEQANYLVTSACLPQQTGLLGLVRHQLLLQNNLLKNDRITDKGKARVLIGEKSFRVGEANLSFGAIRKLSPLMIGRGELYFFPAGKDLQTDKKTSKTERLTLALEQGMPLLTNFDHKSDHPECLMAKGAGEYLHYDPSGKSEGVFTEKQQVGIRKNYHGVTEEKAYYRQTFKQMRDGFSFAFQVTIDETFQHHGKTETVRFSSQDTVIFGGEQSAFRMEVVPETQSYSEWLPDYPAHETLHKVVLLSDAKLSDQTLYDHLQFGITDTVDFRCLQTSVEETDNYAALSSVKEQRKLTKSKRYQLLKKGSVLYYDPADHENVTKALDDPVFQKIGYNRYTVVHPKSPP